MCGEDSSVVVDGVKIKVVFDSRPVDPQETTPPFINTLEF